MGFTTEEFARLELEPQHGVEDGPEEGPLEHDEQLRGHYQRELVEHIDHWIAGLGDGVVLIADTRGEFSRERTTMVMRFKRTDEGARWICFFRLDALEQRRIGPSRLVEIFPASDELGEDELPLDDLLPLARLSDPELGAAREMGLHQYAVLGNRHVD